LGLAGAAVLHVGLLLVILAAVLRGLFATDAAVDLIEGETLPPTATDWAAQFPGLLGKPFHLDGAVTLDAVKAVRYQSGDLRDLKVELAVQGRRGLERAELAVNHDLKAGGGRVFLGSDFGPAALLEWQGPGGASKREATMLTAHGRGDYEGVSAGPNGLRAYLRAGMGSNGAHPNLVEVRVMKDGGLLFTGAARVGQTVALQTGERLVLHGTPFWARLRGSRDAALWLAYAGFALVLTGVVFIFTLVKVDGCIAVTPVGERERVLVALKPQRFAPLFAERFQQLVRDQGGPVEQEERSEAEVRPPGMPHAQPPCGMPVGQPLAAAARGLAVWTWLLSCLLFLAGCQRSSLSQARQLVERYNRVVAEAYRRGDVKLIDPVVGPNEGKKLTGLIGVRLDLGMTLDSQMLALEVTGVQKAKDELRVQTRERWRYRDRKIGTGEQVGEESLDSYEMLYIFKKSGKDWLVDEIKFTSAPQVGRKRPTWLADRRELHGLSSQTNPTEGRHP
ncbi:MAG: cytochrome c biogenesis protein ResB, partial [Verrucomicrobia bacterium]|nr:cytochrome c biogenesis protein ResB [Verrucomicrobiota bacterium]